MGGLDEAILQTFANWRSPWLNQAATDITALGSLTINILVSSVAFTVLWMIARDHASAIRMVTSTMGAEILVEIIKRIMRLPRPLVVPHLVQSTGFSYPSGHVFVATAAYGTLAAIACRYVKRPEGRLAIRVFCCIIVVLVALSRMYLGVHFPSDVLGGLLFGIAWLLVTSYWWRTRPMKE
jgi:undecaprenyl-diphosphatase